jgi:hypothetical protein
MHTASNASELQLGHQDDDPKGLVTQPIDGKLEVSCSSG